MVERIDHDLAFIRRPGATCFKCGEYLGRCESGDVVMCTKCWTWHRAAEDGAVQISAEVAAALAGAYVEPYTLLAAMALNAERMMHHGGDHGP
jgi:hypothetical protein